MPYCAVLSCRNNSGIKNLSRGGISYHRFPKDPEIKDKWIAVTGQVNWFPQKCSTICSEHFLEKDFWMSPKGNRYILDVAIPTQKIVCSKDITKSQSPTDTTEGTNSKSAQLDCTTISESPCSSTFLSPSKQTLKNRLKKAEEKLRRYDKNIKRLQAQNRRLKKKISTLEDIFIPEKDKYASSNENITSLKNTKVEVQELIMHQASDADSVSVSMKKYSPSP